jgi:hypothetical protein
MQASPLGTELDGVPPTFFPSQEEVPPEQLCFVGVPDVCVCVCVPYVCGLSAMPQKWDWDACQDTQGISREDIATSGPGASRLSGALGKFSLSHTSLFSFV